MKEITNNSALIAECGLYCGACGKYLNGKCPGCAKNEKASWCKLRSCTLEKNIRSCADCNEFSNPMDCRKFNNIVAKFFALIFNSNRAACIAKIKSVGYDDFAVYMAENKLMSFKRK